jgi:hypothetical protein
LRALSEGRNLHLADCALHAQHQPIVDLRWIIDPVGIDQQNTNDTAELQERMPVAPGSRQARRFHAENGADLTVANRTQHALKAGAVRNTCRTPQLLVDDLYLCPSQLAGTINQRVLQPLAFQIVLHLAGC